MTQPGEPTPQGAAGAAGQPSEEEVRAYLGQLRGAPVDQILAEVLSSLLNAAQVKLGRDDARVLLDGSAALVEAVREDLPAELTSQLDELFTQLRTAQVQAEQEVAAQPEDEAGDVGAAGDEPAAPGSQPDQSTQQSSSGSDPASRLWVPGR